jgi:uncharacterized 2Fe-2S/4Fe-4S cluster protein (DUF4445 family)
MKDFCVQFLPAGRNTRGEEGRTILDCARDAGVYVNAQCNGRGVCGKCKVRILKGGASPWTSEESAFVQDVEKEMGYRLACMARIADDVTVLSAEENILTSAASRKIFSRRSETINAAVKHYRMNLHSNNAVGASFLRAITEELRQKHFIPSVFFSPMVLQRLENEPLKDNSRVTVHVWMDREVISVTSGWKGRTLGLALDIGTTTLALYLCDLDTGDVIASGSVANPQVLYGPDIMSRIAYSAAHPVEGIRKMQQELINSVNALISELAAGKGFTPMHILDMTVVGNTVMHHIFLGLAPDSLGLWPFEPLVKGPVDIRARDIGLLMNPGSYIHVLPVEAGFVGADNVGVLISEEPYNKEELSLIIDIGTNGEIILGNRNRLLSCSCATGPALEGAQISCGMRAAPGAIEKVRIDPETFEVSYKVVGRREWVGKPSLRGQRPSGICGSGIIDVVAQLRDAELIGADGSFTHKLKTSRLRTGNEGVMEFVVAWGHETSTGKDIVFSQKDVRQVQLAKAALNAGCRVLMLNFHVDSIQSITIAGAFGIHIDKKSAFTIGLFPDCEPSNIFLAGNAAGRGAYLALVNRDKRNEAERIAFTVTHIELAREEIFQIEFMKALAMPYKPVLD